MKINKGFILCACILSVGCNSHRLMTPNTALKVPEGQTKVEHSRHQHVKSHWTMSIPANWSVSTSPRKIFKNMTTIFMAQSPNKVGNHKITVSIQTGASEGDSPEVFAAGVVSELVLNDWPIKRALPIWVSGIPASRVDAIKNSMIISQVNVAIGESIYLILCTGDASKRLAKTTCDSILKSLKWE